jgi:AMMECR1 domain-containing protein
MHLLRPLLVTALLLGLGARVEPPKSYCSPGTPPRANPVTETTALWLLKHARARLSGNHSEISAVQQSIPPEASATRETTLFVRPYARGCVICPSSAIGTGDSLLSALNAALSRIPASLVSSERTVQPLQAEPDRIQIDLLDGDFVSMPKPYTSSNSRIAAADLIDPGGEGIAVETEGRAIYLLPIELLVQDCFDEDAAAQHAEDLLNRAMRSAGLEEQAWLSPQVRLSRFRTTAFVEDWSREAVLRVVRGGIPVQEPDRNRLLASARSGGNYLVRMQQRDGSFHYSYDPLEDRFSSRTYNILRHSGTALSLFDLYRATREVRYLEAARRAVEFLKTRFRPTPNRGLYVLDNDGKAKLGACGLALQALVNQMELDPPSVDRENAKRIAAQILAMQAADGSFRSYHPVRGDEPTGSVSLYYPGEAILGLVRFHALSGDRKLLVAARRGADYLVSAQRRSGQLPPDAWLMQALEALLKAGRNRNYAVHLLALADAMIAEQYSESDPSGYAGGFKPGLPRSTPAASRAEGMLSAYRVAVSVGDPRAPKIAAALKASAQFQLSQQFNLTNSFFLPKPDRAAGGFRASLTSMRIRIDFVQHNISSLLGIAEVLY